MENNGAPLDQRLLAIFEAASGPSILAVSTDVFDTLVWRSVPKPVDAFIVLGEHLRAEAMLSHRLSSEAFAVLRRTAEATARETRQRHHGQSEVSLPEIYARLPPWIFAHGATPEAAAAAECEVERRLIVPDLDVVALLGHLRDAGKLIVAVSDTYFSASDIRAFLTQPGAGILELDRIYVSSEYRVNKGGDLFEAVLDDLGVAPERMLHFGDNFAADVLRPRELGITSVSFDRYPAPYSAVADREARLLPAAERSASSLTSVGGLATARTKALSRSSRAEIPHALQQYWAYGAHVLGPVFTGFVEWVHEYCAETAVKRVLCLMREGSFLSTLIRNANPYLGRELEAVPLWLNRKLALRAAVTDIDRYVLADLLNRRSPQTVGAFLRRLGIDPAEVPAYAGHVRTSLADPVVRNSLIDYLAAEPALRARILAESRRLRDAILRLLQREAPGDGPVTFVDLGWGATIQGQLTRALAEAGAARETVGLYLMTGEHAARQVANGGAEVHGFLGDFGIPRSAVDLVIRSPELLEQVCMPAHGSQLDLDNNLDPVLGAPATPSLQRLEAEAVRSGILSFQNEWARHRSALPGKLRGLDSAQQVLGAVLVRSIVDPTAEEVAAFGHWHHDASDDVTEVEAIADTALLPRLRYMEPDQVRRLPMNEVYWPFGLAAQVDEHWPSLLRAAAAGQIPWEAMASRLETGTFVIEVSQGIDVDGQPVEVTPTRNRFGLTAVTATLTGAQIFELTLRPAQSPCVLRIDWIDLDCFTQGHSKPVHTRFGPDAAMSALRRENCFALAPNLLVIPGTEHALRIDVWRLTHRVVSRVDVEVAFAALPVSWILPHEGQFVNPESAERTLRDMEASVSWRITAPLRAMKRRVR